MRFLLLTHAEAADSAVMANIAAHLMSGEHIAYFDRPDVGKPAPLALLAPVTRTPAALVFGGPVPYSAVAEAPPIVPVTLIPPAPAAPPPAPPPVLAVAVPQAPVPPPPLAPADTDTAGLPWDERIHSSSKAVNKADGRWRQKRETGPARVLQIEAELRAVMGLPTPGAAVPPPPPASSVFGLAATMGPTPTTPASFGDLMLWMAPHMPHKLTPEAMLAALVSQGVPDLNTLIHRPDLVPVVYAALLPLTR